jgi:hypothetical protein
VYYVLHMRLALAAGTLILISRCGWASVIVPNSGFETVSVNGMLCPSSSTVCDLQYRPAASDWSFTGSAGIAEAAGVGVGFNLAAAADGTQAGFLQRVNSQIFQTIGGLSIGDTYSVSFEAATRPDIGAAPLFYGGGEDFEVYWDDTPLGIFLPTLQTFSAFETIAFTATSTSGVLMFQGLDTNSACGNVGVPPAPCDRTAFIDSVTVNGGVPEPPNAVIIVSGIGLIGAGLTRKYKRSARP